MYTAPIRVQTILYRQYYSSKDSADSAELGLSHDKFVTQVANKSLVSVNILRK